MTIFTDDAATLSRRVEDAHTRKAALELDGLREELIKNGLFQPKETDRKKETLKEAPRHKRAPRVHRAMRAFRIQRLAPVQAVQRWAQDFRRWVSEKIGPQVEQPTHRTAQGVTQDLKERQKQLLQRMRANAQRQDRGQSHGHGHSL